MPVTEAQVLEALRAVQDPDLHRDIVSLGFVKNVVIDGGAVAFTVELTTPACPVKDELERQAHDVVAALPDVTDISVTMTAQVRDRNRQAADHLPGVKQIVAVASGKGGVGKSTLAANLAACLALEGAKVGLMDADVYGPSIPAMTGTVGEHPLTKDSKIVPITRHGIKTMSLGHLLQPGQAPLWRGPMVAGTVRQLLADVAWGELDYLFVDLPPGTGDAPMTLAQEVPLTGVVIVTTPHTMAANIAGASAGLFRRLNTTILGVIENMATFVCPGCGTPTRMFAGKTGEELSGDLGAPFLGSIPLDPRISLAADSGVPLVVSHPETEQAEALRRVSQALAAQISVKAMTSSKTVADERPPQTFEPVK